MIEPNVIQLYHDMGYELQLINYRGLGLSTGCLVIHTLSLFYFLILFYF